MKKIIFCFVCLFACIMLAKPASTHWDPNGQRFVHGIGFRCELCSDPFPAIPKGLKAWEVRHLKQVRGQTYALHMRLKHKRIVPCTPR